MPGQIKKNLLLLIYFTLVVGTLLVFWQVRTFDFVNYDDDIYVYENPHVLNGFTQDGIVWAFTTPNAGNWLPLTWLSFMLDCQLFGPNPGWMHFINVFLHLANTLLLFALLKKMTGSLWPSAFVAAAFALHPMHVESVAWITERKDVLSTFFLLLTLAVYADYARRPSVFRYLGAVVLFALGLLVKPMLVTLPFLLLLLDYWPLNRFDISQPVKPLNLKSHKSAPVPTKRQIFYRILIEKIPFFVLSAVSSVITFSVQQAEGALADVATISLQTRVANAFLSCATYIGKMFWPQNLATFYPYDADKLLVWQVLLCALLLLGISIFVICFRKKQKYLAVGWFWFLITLIPVIGVIQSGVQALADRYTYISYIGLFIMIAWGISAILSQWPYKKFVLGLSMVLVLTIIGICAHKQVSYWNNSITLFSHAIEVTQNNYIAYNNLGGAYSNLGRNQEAIDALSQSVKIKPDYAEVHNNLGVIYGKLGRSQEAIDDLRQAIKINPNFAKAHNNLGAVYDKLGRWQEAIEAYRQAVKIKPDYAEAQYNLGSAYGKLGRWQEAMDALKQTIKIKPDFAEVHNNLGVVYGKLGRWQEAIEAYKQAIRIKPDYALAHYGLGAAYLTMGDKNSALAEYNILKSLNSQFANKLFNKINK